MAKKVQNPSIYSAEAKEQLMLLKDLTRRTEMLHDAQVAQLKLWPRVLFNVKSVEIQIEFSKKTITFVLGPDTKDKAVLKGTDKQRAGHLDEWVKWLLGNDWIVKIAGKKDYRFGPKLKV